VGTVGRLQRIRRKVQKKLISPLISGLYIDRDQDYRNSIFLAGSERSGTTWVSEIINYRGEYRYIFEPFWPARVELCRGFRPQQYLRPENRDSYYVETAKTILSGRIRNRWTDQYHRRFIADRRLIKDVRANLFLKWMHTHFPGMPIILLLRHPCAVASSQIRHRHRVPPISEEFLAQEELVADFLEPFREAMESAQTEFEQRIFRWCIQNYVPLKQFQPGEIHVAFYENLCTQPRSEVERLFAFLSKDYDDAVFAKLREPSPQSHLDSAVVSGGNLIEGWKRWVTEEQTQRAIAILSLFGLDKIYSCDSMPNPEGVNQIMGIAKANPRTAQESERSTPALPGLPESRGLVKGT